MCKFDRISEFIDILSKTEHFILSKISFTFFADISRGLIEKKSFSFEKKQIKGAWFY